MRNVIVFSLAGARHAIELRWVREVVTLGWVTPVPGAPTPIAGVVNFHGSIVPVLDVAVLVGVAPGPATAHGGEGAVVVAVEEIVAALRVSAVEEVATLADDPDGGLRDGRGRAIALLDPPALLRALREPAPDDDGVAR